MPRETQFQRFLRVMAKPIAEAEAAMQAAVMDDPNRNEATMKAAMMQYFLCIRRLVNQHLDIEDDTDQMAALLQESPKK